MLDARDYAVVELGAVEAAAAVGGIDVGDLADVVGYMIGYAAGSLYAFVKHTNEGTWAAWHG
jgi:hypothetical protein